MWRLQITTTLFVSIKVSVFIMFCFNLIVKVSFFFNLRKRVTETDGLDELGFVETGATYCLCKDGVGDPALQKALDYACGAGADCSPILSSGACYNPNTIKDHCNWAVNSYFQRKGQTQLSCDFAGAATQSQTPPSKFLLLYQLIHLVLCFSWSQLLILYLFCSLWLTATSSTCVYPSSARYVF